MIKDRSIMTKLENTYELFIKVRALFASLLFYSCLDYAGCQNGKTHSHPSTPRLPSSNSTTLNTMKYHASIMLHYTSKWIFEEEVKGTNELTLRWEDYQGGSNLII